MIVIKNFIYERINDLIGVVKNDWIYEYVYLDKCIKIIAKTTALVKTVTIMNNTKIFELNRQDIDLYKKQILDGGYKKKYKKSKYPEDIDREESRIIKNITEEEFKDHMVRVARELVEEGNIPNFKIFKKVFDDDELHFYFPSLFKNAPSPPVFIGKAHIGDTQIAGGDIVGGIKITTDKSTTVDNRGGIIQRSSIGSEETKGRIKNCPYCGEDLDFPKSPKYCPYCGGQIIE